MFRQGLQKFYHGDLYRPDSSLDCYWQTTCESPRFDPLEKSVEADVAVVGAGYLGLTAALSLARDHALSVVVLEAGSVGFGGSGRNGGANGIAATKLSTQDLVKRFGKAETASFLRSQVAGQQLVSAIAAREGIAIDKTGRGAICVAHSSRALADLTEDAELTRDLAGIEFERLSRSEFAKAVYDGPNQFGGIRTLPGCGINPLKFVRGLAHAATRHGATVYENAEVSRQDWSAGRHHLHTGPHRVSARHVIYATNGYLADGLETRLDARMLPAITNVMVTRRLTADELEAHHFRESSPMYTSQNLLYYYRRLPDDRILFGARGDLSGSSRSAVRMQAHLRRCFVKTFPHWRDVDSDFFWQGLVSVTRRLAPSMGQLEGYGNAWYGFGCHGNGINNQTWMGQQLAALIAGTQTLDQVPAVYRGLPKALPRSRTLRRLGLGASYGVYAVADKVQ